MTQKLSTKPPMWFWIASAVALLWNLMGVAAYLSEAFMSDEIMDTLAEAERHLYESRPAWVTAAYAIAVWSGALGCIALLLRKKWAEMLLLISLIGVLAQNVYYFFMSETMEVVGPSNMIMSVVIIIISIILVLFARYSLNKNWIA